MLLYSNMRAHLAVPLFRDEQICCVRGVCYLRETPFDKMWTQEAATKEEEERERTLRVEV